MATATRTVVFTDLTNYTASVSRADREALRHLLRAHETLVIPTIQRHHGRVVKNLGDSFMTLFDSATDAIRASLDLVEQTQEGSLSLRVGAATGDVEEIDGDAFGDAVNLASRIIGKTPSDEIWFSESTQLCMNQAEIPWDRIGLFSLKGIAGEVPVFRAVPHHRTWLPEPVAKAIETNSLVIIRRDEPIPQLPPEPIILMVGFAPGSEALENLVSILPVLDPARLWLLTYNIAPGDRVAWQDIAGHGLVLGTPQAVNSAIEEQRRPITQDPGSDTIILDSGLRSAMELMVAGIALPRVPMSDVVAGYTFDLQSDGRWATRSEHSELRLDITPSGIYVIATSPRITVSGQPLRTRDRVLLEEGTQISASGNLFVFRTIPGSIYAGALMADSPIRLLLAEGQRAELGREPAHPGLALPDRRGQANIRWCAGPRAARARQSGFTLDRALSGRKQAAVFHQGDVTRIQTLHSRCPTFHWKLSGAVERVFGTESIELGEHIIVGTTIIAVRMPIS